MSVAELSQKRTAPSQAEYPEQSVPASMRAAVYRGDSTVAVETVPTPEIGAGELLIRVESCGICHTDLKKIEYNLLPGPRIFGHETAGVVAAVGANVARYGVGDRVIVFHHIPCGDCFYCARKLFAQCPIYKRVGVGAAFEASGGGFAQYVRVRDWIVERGMERIPDGVSFDRACWVEPVNTCVKAVRQLALRADDAVAVLGQGPIGLIFTMLLARTGARVVATDRIEHRRTLSKRCGAQAFDPREAAFETTVQSLTKGRGADAVILATSVPGLVEQALRISRPGAKVLLFAQTSAKERIDCSGADICVGERMLLGSYSADVDVQAEAAQLVFSGELALDELVSDRLSLEEIARGIAIAQRPGERSMKVIIHPQERN